MTGNKPQHHENQITSSHRRAQEQVVISGRFRVEVTSGRQKIWNEQVGAGRVSSQGWMLGSSEGRDRILGISAPSILLGSHGKQETFKGEHQSNVQLEKRAEMFVILILWKFFHENKVP